MKRFQYRFKTKQNPEYTKEYSLVSKFVRATAYTGFWYGELFLMGEKNREFGKSIISRRTNKELLIRPIVLGKFVHKISGLNL